MILLIPLGKGAFNLTFMHLKEGLNLIGICCQYFQFNKIISLNIVHNDPIDYEKTVCMCMIFCDLLHLNIQLFYSYNLIDNVSNLLNV